MFEQSEPPVPDPFACIDPSTFDTDPAPVPLGIGEDDGVPGDPAARPKASEADLVTELVAADAAIARAMARRARAVAALAARRTSADDLAADVPGAPGVDSAVWGLGVLAGVSPWFVAELAVIRGCTEAQAALLARRSLILVRRLPSTVDRLAAGTLDPRTAVALAELCETATPAAAAAVEARVLPGAASRTSVQVRDRARRLLMRIEPAALDRQRRDAELRADVRVRATQPGMAELSADLSVPDAVSCRTMVDALAQLLRADGDERPIGVLRAQVLRDCILRPDQPRTAVTATLVVHAALPSLHDPGPDVDGIVDAEASTADVRTGDAGGVGREEPCEVGGQVVTAAQCRDLLRELDALGLQRPAGGALHVAVHEPRTGELVAVATHRELTRAAYGRRARRRGRRVPVAAAGLPARAGSPPGAGGEHSRQLSAPREDAPPAASPGLRPPPASRGYRPTAAQRRYVRVRDRRCRAFGCNRPAEACDADHVHPHGDGGVTDCLNLCSLCRHHHRLKTHARGWAFVLLPDGRLRITTPSGVVRDVPHPGYGHRSEPDPPDQEETHPPDARVTSEAAT